MARRKPRRPYKGILTVPTPKAAGGADELVPSHIIPKLEALLDHYDIPRDPDRWFLLALHLAGDHVPGFAPPRAQGRKPDPEMVFRDMQLLIDLGYAEACGKSVTNAARQLARGKRDRRWFKGKNPASLRDQYYRLKDPKSVEGKRVRRAIDVAHEGGFFEKWFCTGAYEYKAILDFALKRGQYSAE